MDRRPIPENTKLKVIGVTLISTPIIAIVVMMTSMVGVWATVIIWTLAFLATAMIIFGLGLLVDVNNKHTER